MRRWLCESWVRELERDMEQSGRPAGLEWCHCLKTKELGLEVCVCDRGD